MMFNSKISNDRSAMIKKFVIVPLAILATLYVVDACNSAICGPRVSKCMLINCCKCDMSDKNNCSCCVDCALCLTKLYTECCSCVGLCPTPDPSDANTRSSTVDNLPDPIPGLFNALTEEEDIYSRWTTFTYAVDLDKLVFEDRGSTKADMDIKIVRADHSFKSTVAPPSSTSSSFKEPLLGIRNCTVAFFSDCLSMSKCKDSCTSMGASKYRWFHEHGCCQCVGSSCYDYGLSQPHCLQCPEKTDMMYEEESLYADAEWNPYRNHKHHKKSHKNHKKHHGHSNVNNADPAMDSF